MKKTIITVVGNDTVGIIAKVCTYLAENQVNILDISQTIVQGYFNMMMIADTAKCEKDGGELAKELELANYVIVPVSATEGDNITTKSENTPWYTGVPLLEYLENVDIEEKTTEKGFYMPVQRVSRPNHTFRGFQGQV